MNENMDYPKAIKELRAALLLSQAEFAKKMGVSFATVNRWENGRFAPSYKAKRKLRALLKKHGIVLEEKK